MLVVLLVHAAAAVLAGLLARRLGPRAFLVAALGPLSGVVLLLAAAPSVLSGGAWVQEVPWVPGLDLAVALRLDPLSLAMLVLVSGVGAVIFAFCAWYAPRDAALVRFVVTLTAFAGAMVGLVVADDVVMLYVFWEATTVTSYLLVGLADEQRASRRAAQQALLVTTLGGLAMLVGLLALSQQAGTTKLSAIVAAPPSGPVVEAALALVLLGALTKSAQVPFHSWLPAAMAAPTPVSAYLHAAAMVKAGVYLIARLAPAFAEVAWWRPVVVGLGVATMLVGGWRALRQHDLKRLLAFSTVSQLGFLVAVAGWGTRGTAAAAATLLLAHGLAKAALFLCVGVVDHEAGTRDLRRLSGVGRRMPVVALAGTAAALSMGGVPFLLGFIAKEEVYASFLAETEGDGGVLAGAALVGLVIGSALTLAYALRFAWGAFATKRLRDGDPDGPDEAHPLVREVHRPGAGLVVPVAVLASASVLLGLVPQLAGRLVGAVAALPAPSGVPADLALWHGVTPYLLLSLATLAAGALLFAARRGLSAVQQRVGEALPTWLDAERGYAGVVTAVDRVADVVTGRTQTGSLPGYLGVVMTTAVLLPASALLLGGADLGGAVLVDVPAQVAVAAVVAIAAVSAAAARTRLSAVLLLGAVGYGVALLFVLQGGPDLALTQFLVETLSLVTFLLVLRMLPRRFARPVQRRTQALQATIAVAAGVFVTAFALAAAGARTRPAVSEEFLVRSAPEAAGNNVVNVVLVDFRGLDTLGEITVVLVAALGIASLVLTARDAADRAESPGAGPSRERDAGDAERVAP